ncbi:preprotein translocase subunit TatC [Stenotrophomonas pictorum JCM 9942]|uniref:Preprotein translocase subunit TatC n=1 Tax=Stenotrophomonas pictorum JCM 9942 TaxID=1236960 RepID=A0A0R0AJR3_9GAMM|nr:group III truncated hemoglobin [Stenotrophomonas pictorum]KRG45389.1 preprotein translocase subunit TatC [Stenotrophomonas pictorum JCM 9942]
MKPEVNVCTEQEVEALVRRFYARVREDEVLGPIFEARVHDWQSHLLLLIDFWSTMLRGTSRFSGAPMPKHLAIPGLQWSMFQRWLELFGQTTAELGNPQMKQLADAAAQRVATAIWRRYSAPAFPVL